MLNRQYRAGRHSGTNPKGHTVNASKSNASTDVAVVEEKLSPAQAAIIAQDEMRPTLLSVDDATRANIIRDAAQTEAVVGFLLEKGSVASVEMLNAMTRLRRIFPASEDVRAILGDDACDLLGQTAEYKAAMQDINGQAHKALVSRLRRDGYIGDVAANIATSRLDTVRKGVSAQYRKYVEGVALNACDGDQKAAAALLLAHGFRHHTGIETKKAPQLIRPGQVLEVVDANDKAAAAAEGVRNVGGALLKVLNPPPVAGTQTEANEPNEQSDQVKPGETADVEIAQVTGGKVTDPNVLINEAVGMLRTAAQVLATGRKMTLKQRNAHRENILSAVRTLVGELEGTMAPEQVVDVNAEVTASK
jgi:hypothetical protein